MVGTIASKIIAQSPVKILAPTCVVMVRFVTEMGVGEWIDELCEYHSGNINPNNLSMPHTYFEHIVKEVPQETTQAA